MPEILRKIIDDQIVLAAWHITESTEELCSLISLRDEEQNLFDQFVSESRKKQWLAYRVLIRRLHEPDDFPIEYDQSGKPFLVGSDFHISVTHTEDIAAVIISNKGKVGIDTEKIKPRVRKVVDKFMNEDEVAALIPGQELEQMTLVWCAKEAIYKYFGARGLDFRENILVEVPRSCGTEFNASVSYKDKHESLRLFSEMLKDCIMVYLIG